MRTTAENMMQAFGIKKNLCIATKLQICTLEKTQEENSIWILGYCE